MANKLVTNTNKQDFSVDAIVQEMQAAMRTLATPAVPGENVKAAISRAARKAGLEFSQARRLWYGLWLEVPGYVVENVRQRARQKLAEAPPEIQSELSELRGMLAQIMARLDSKEPA